MNILTETLCSDYTPLLLIAVYKNTANRHSADYYLESHTVNDSGQVLEGKPLQQETIENIVDVFYNKRNQRAEVSGMIPENLLHFKQLEGKGYDMVWFRKSEQRKLLFAESLKITDGFANVPALIYRVKRGILNVYALNSSKRPDEKTALFIPPFHNVSSDGNVCLGSAKAKMDGIKTYQSIMKYWEDMFWLSKFSHITGNESPTKSNLNTLWKKLIKDNTIKWADLDELIQIEDLTIKDIL